MRKLYALLAGLFLALASTNISAQTNTPDVANFTFNVHPGNNVSFTNTSVLGAGTIVGERKAWWFFGDGTQQSSPPLGNMQHHYNAAGTYTVCLKIFRYFNNDSVLTASVCKTVVLLENTCAANFTSRDSILQGPPPTHLVRFNATTTSSQNRPILYVCWNFGDGSPQQCTQAGGTNPPANLLQTQHVYTGPGPYTACVRIVYDGGCVAEKCRVVELLQIPPPPDSCRANFERINVTATSNPLSATFKALPWHNNNKKPVRICWQFGDGQDTCINYPENYTGVYGVSHQYQHPGQYEVCVKILYYGGCEARKCRVITVPPVPVTCSVTLYEITPSITSRTRAFYAVPNSTPTRRPELVCWYFGDGTDTCITIQPGTPIPNLTIQHTYPGPGTYRACVVVRFDGGCTATSCREVVIRPTTNICGGYMTDSLVGPKTVKFKGFSIHAPNDQVLSYRWTFGDGSSALGQEVTHIYNIAGTYNVCLIIRTALGCETHICRPVRIPGTNGPQLILTPNPVLNELHAIFHSTHAEPVTIRIMNNFGNTVQTYTRNAVVGSNTWTFNVGGLLPGIYSFIIQSPNQLASAVFIKL